MGNVCLLGSGASCAASDCTAASGTCSTDDTTCTCSTSVTVTATSGSGTTTTIGGTGTSSSGTSSSGTAGTSSSGGMCVVPTFTLDNGDIGSQCSGAPDDGGIGEGTCSLGELCILWANPSEYRCTAPCGNTSNSGTAPCTSGLCVEFSTGSGPLDLCTALCDPSNAVCPDTQSCHLFTPNPLDPGYCDDACTGDSTCNGTNSTTFACTSGVCACTQDSDCGSGLSCDTNTGACYSNCASGASSCSSGCCAQSGALSYCDGFGEVQGSTTGSTGVCSAVVFAPNNGDIGAPCTGYPDDGGIAQASCNTSEICLSLDGPSDYRCTAACETQACPANSYCYPFGQVGEAVTSFCLAGCSASAGGCPTGLSCYLATPGATEEGVCFGGCTQASDCQLADAGTNFQCGSSGTCQCSADTDCTASGAGTNCDSTTGVCYVDCSQTGTCNSQDGCCVTSGAAVSYCDIYGQSGATSSSGSSSSGSTGGSSGSSSSGSTGSSGFPVGAHNAWPALVNGGGNVLANPEIVTITFNNVVLADGSMGPYPYQTQVEGFDNWLVTSANWLPSWGNDYGVGLGTSDTPVRLDDTPAATIIDSPTQHAIGNYLNGLIAAGKVPMPNANTLYTIFYPASVKVFFDDEQTQGSCTVFLGYHSAYAYTDGTMYAYSVINDCGAQDNLSDADTITSVVGHETGEAATDPFTNPAGTATWRITDTTSPWYFTSGEVGDLCHSNYYKDPTTGYVAQRIWSTSAALTNGSPCMPLPPTNPTPFMAASANNSIYFVAAGQSTTITAQAWSTGTTNNWYLGMYVFGGQISNIGIEASNPVAGYPGFTSVNNGDSPQFTVTVPAGTPSGQYAYLWLSSDISGLPGDADWWPVVVQVP